MFRWLCNAALFVAPKHRREYVLVDQLRLLEFVSLHFLCLNMSTSSQHDSYLSTATELTAYMP
jgi:hypothetical protein